MPPPVETVSGARDGVDAAAAPVGDGAAAGRRGARDVMGVWLGGALLLAATLGLAAIAPRFVYGEGHAQRPIVRLCALLLLAWAGYALAWRDLDRLAALPAAARRRALWGIIGLGLALRAILLPANPILESDFYRYIWDGMALRAGVHPFGAAPAELAPAVLAPDPADQAAARLVQDRVSFAELKTIYPPAAQAVFWLNARLFGWWPYGFRVTFLALDLLLLALLAAALRAAGRPLTDLLLYAWCPLILKEVINAMHLDIAAALALGAFAWAVLRQRPVLAAAALWIAVGIKLTPIVLAPLWLAWCLRRGDRRGAILGLAVMGALSAAGLWWWLHGVSEPFAGLRAFSRDWEVNAAIFGLGRHALELTLDLPTSTARHLMRLWYALCIGGAALWLAWRLRDGRDLLRASTLLLLALWCLGPVGNPWYLCWLLPFLVLLRAWPAALLMACTSLYYYDFRLMLLPAGEGAVLRRLHLLLQYAPFYCVLAIAWLRRRAALSARYVDNPPDQDRL